MRKLTLLILTTVVVFTSCKKGAESGGDDRNPVNEKPAVTEKGNPVGDAVSRDIGPSGGSLISADGKLELIVAGAVTGNVSFSMQPITDKCPGGFTAFRLMPEGTTFSKPVKLVFHYTVNETGTSLNQFLKIAYQGPDNSWYWMPAAKVDTASMTISAEVKHFTDWAVLSSLEISPAGESDVKIKEELKLQLQGMEDLPPLVASQPVNNPSAGDDDLPALPEKILFKTKWYVNGVENGNSTYGRISSTSDGRLVSFAAPDKVPSGGAVTVAAVLKNFRFYDHFNGKMSTYNEVILYKYITIRGNDMNFSLVFGIEHPGCSDDQKYSDKATMDVQVKNNEVTISNIINEKPSTVPAVSLLFGGPCTITCISPETGEVNIKDATAVITAVPNGGAGFVLSLNNSGAVANGETVSCPGTIPTTVAPVALGDSKYNQLFILKDSAQTWEYGQAGARHYMTLTPKP